MATVAVDRLSGSDANPVAGWVATASLTTVLAVVALAASFGELDAAVEATWPRGLLLIHVLAASFIVAAAGTTASERPGVAAGLALVGLAVSLPVLGGLTALPVDARNALVASAGLAPAGAALVAQGWSRPRRRWPAAVAAVLSVTAVAIHALTVNPAAEPACMRLCLPVDVVLSGVGSRPGLGLAAALLVGATILVVLAAWPAQQPHPSLAGVAVLASAVLLGVPWVVRWFSWSSGSLVREALHLGVISAGVLAMLVLTTQVREAQLRRRVTLLVRDLEGVKGGRAPVQFARPGTATWLTPLGEPAREETGTRYRVVTEDGSPVARWPGAGRSAEAPLSPATRLALRNAQLTAAATAQLRDLRNVQGGIVAAADGERGRIERDLHDGVQQRLVGALLALAAAGTRSVEGAATASEQIRLALAGLRSLTAGLVNPILVSDGLWAALEELAESGPAEFDLTATGPEPPDLETCRTAYLVVSGTTRLLAETAAPVTVEAVTRSNELQLTVYSPGWTAAFNSADMMSGLSDRVGATGGSFDLEPDRGRLVVVLPCGS